MVARPLHPRGLLALLPLVLCACTAEMPAPLNPDQPVPDPPPAFVFAEEAAIFIGHPDVRIVDARPARAYRRGHIPGAVPLEWTELRERDAGLLTGRVDADIGYLASVLGSRGIGDLDWVIVVGDPLEYWGEEGRVAWVLRYLGHEKVSILDGGMAAWKRAGQPTQRGKVTLEPRPYTPQLDDGVLARKQDVVAMSKLERAEWQSVIVDVRSPGEYEGKRSAKSFGAPRSGHIPRAVHLHWKDLLDEQGMLRPREELRETLVPRGVRPDAHIVTYCTGGVRSAHTWYILDSLGYPEVQNYAGSWWEWSLDRKLPLEDGPEPPRLSPLPPFPLVAQAQVEPEPTPEPPPGELTPGNRYGEIPDYLKPPGDILDEEPSEPSEPTEP